MWITSFNWDRYYQVFIQPFTIVSLVSCSVSWITAIWALKWDDFIILLNFHKNFPQKLQKLHLKESLLQSQAHCLKAVGPTKTVHTDSAYSTRYNIDVAL